MHDMPSGTGKIHLYLVINMEWVVSDEKQQTRIHNPPKKTSGLHIDLALRDVLFACSNGHTKRDKYILFIN